MPILDIEIVIERGRSISGHTAKEVAAAASEILAAEPSSTWVRLRPLSQEHYAEGDGGPPEGVQPIFVTVLEASSPELPVRRDQAEALAEVIGRICERPAANVHVVFEPAGAGRIAFGGKMVEEN